MRSAADRDDLGAQPGMTRLHIDVCDSTYAAIVELAEHDKIYVTEALCRLVRYGNLVARTARDDDTLSSAAWEVTLPAGEHAVMLHRADLPPRRWWRFRRFFRIFTVLRMTQPAQLGHDDVRLVIE